MSRRSWRSAGISGQLLRDPELAEEVGRPFELGDEAPGDLRRFYRRQMLRIQAASILEGTPNSDTLSDTSALADFVIRTAYERAGARGEEMTVVALGRLGMREFDLGSDADLNFVIPDHADVRFWTGGAERLIHEVSSLYRGGGDVRHRHAPPAQWWGGRLGADGVGIQGVLCGTRRGMGGDRLHEVAGGRREPEAGDGVPARVAAGRLARYGQSMRSREDLAAMRARLEREQGSRNPLKAGPGGYYDIDFALMYLRLRGAGIFYKALNTPERIEVIENIGHMPRSDADFLRKAAALYRAIDHGQRVATGHAEGSLPSSQSQVEVLTKLVKRWTPKELHERPLSETLAEIRSETRRYFQRLFGVS